MRIIKPICSAIIHRCIEHRGRFYIGFSVLAHLPLNPPARLGSEQKLWSILAEQAPDFQEDGIPISQSEILLYGQVYPPSADLNYLDFGFRIGRLAKKGRAFGYRRWLGNRLESHPVQITPLLPKYAYGGPQYALNPQGTGHPSSQKGDVLILPRLELIDRPWQKEVDLNRPALFGQLDWMHPLRQQYRGHYDASWLRHQYPGLPEDAHWAIYNTAYPDQRQKAPFQGDESFDLIHLSRQKKISGQLPAIQAVVLMQMKAKADWIRIDTQLRRLVFLPEANDIILIWQGQYPIQSDDGRDIQTLMVAFEWLNQPNRLTHYRHIEKKYRDKEYGILNALDESGLLPEGMEYDGLLDHLPDLNAAMPEYSFRQRMKKKGQQEIAAARQMIADEGLDPDEHGPLPFEEPSPIPPPQQWPEWIAAWQKKVQEQKKQAEKTRQQQLDRAKKIYAEQGLDPQILEDEVSGKLNRRGPPESNKTRHINQLKQIKNELGADTPAEIESMLKDRSLHQQWAQLDRMALSGYRMGAHYQSPADRLRKNESLRQSIVQKIARGESLAGMDLTGADLSGLNLSGADLKKALMESVNLSGADLSGADLSQAVLAHADLSQARLIGADLSRANLGRADLRGADLSQARLWETQCQKSKMIGIRLVQADLSQVQWLQLDLSGADLSGACLDNAQFLQCIFYQARFESAHLHKTNFIQTDLRQTIWTQCQSDKMVLLDIQAEGMRCTQAGLKRSQWVGSQQALNLSGLDFSQADLEGAYFAPETNLSRACFEQIHGLEMQLSGCILSYCRLQKAYLRAAHLRYADLSQADLSGADLMEALLSQAILKGARLNHAHLFGADLSRIQTDQYTQADHAIQDRARVYPRYEKDR